MQQPPLPAGGSGGQKGADGSAGVVRAQLRSAGDGSTGCGTGGHVQREHGQRQSTEAAAAQAAVLGGAHLGSGVRQSTGSGQAAALWAAQTRSCARQSMGCSGAGCSYGEEHGGGEAQAACRHVEQVRMGEGWRCKDLARGAAPACRAREHGVLASGTAMTGAQPCLWSRSSSSHWHKRAHVCVHVCVCVCVHVCSQTAAITPSALLRVRASRCCRYTKSRTRAAGAHAPPAAPSTPSAAAS